MLVCIGATMVGSIILTNCEAGTEVIEQSFWSQTLPTLIFLGLRADLFIMSFRSACRHYWQA
jgi:hypothetical protein